MRIRPLLTGPVRLAAVAGLVLVPACTPDADMPESAEMPDSAAGNTTRRAVVIRRPPSP